VLDVNGVGYGLFMTTEDNGSLSVGQKTKVYVYEHIRENSHDLYGFTNIGTKALFEQLLDVNGVGPRMALSILSLGNVNDVQRAIATGDTKFIQNASGVGKRVAERVVVELKDKLGLEGVELGKTGILQAESVLMKDEAVAALVALGYNPQDAAHALQQVDKKLPSEERIKLALKESRR